MKNELAGRWHVNVEFHPSPNLRYNKILILSFGDRNAHIYIFLTSLLTLNKVLNAEI